MVLKCRTCSLSIFFFFFLIHLRLESCVKLLCMSSQDDVVHLSVPRNNQVLLLTMSGILLSLLSKDSSDGDLAMFQTINFIISLSLPLKVLLTKFLFALKLAKADTVTTKALLQYPQRYKVKKKEKRQKWHLKLLI